MSIHSDDEDSTVNITKDYSKQEREILLRYIPEGFAKSPDLSVSVCSEESVADEKSYSDKLVDYKERLSSLNMNNSKYKERIASTQCNGCISF